MEVKALNLENPLELQEFLNDQSKQVPVPFSNKTVPFNPSRYIGVGVSRLGTSKAVSVGAYAYALKKLM
jgi:glucokinase